jgi:hypothetical protein
MGAAGAGVGIAVATAGIAAGTAADALGAGAAAGVTPPGGGLSVVMTAEEPEDVGGDDAGADPAPETAIAAGC